MLRGPLLYRKRGSGSWKVCAEFASSTSRALGIRRWVKALVLLTKRGKARPRVVRSL